MAIHLFCLFSFCSLQHWFLSWGRKVSMEGSSTRKLFRWLSTWGSLDTKAACTRPPSSSPFYTLLHFTLLPVLVDSSFFSFSAPFSPFHFVIPHFPVIPPPPFFLSLSLSLWTHLCTTTPWSTSKLIHNEDAHVAYRASKHTCSLDQQTLWPNIQTMKVLLSIWRFDFLKSRCPSLNPSQSQSYTLPLWPADAFGAHEQVPSSSCLPHSPPPPLLQLLKGRLCISQPSVDSPTPPPPFPSTPGQKMLQSSFFFSQFTLRFLLNQQHC